MLRVMKSDLDTDEVDPLIFTKNAAVTGTRRRLTSKSPVERTARLSVSAPSTMTMMVSVSHENSLRMTQSEHNKLSVQDESSNISETSNRFNILRHNVDSSGTSSFRSIPSLSENFVADIDYYRTYYGKDKMSNVMDKRLHADRAGRFCASFSLIGMFFLVFIGVLIETQPFYVKGIVKATRPKTTSTRILKTWNGNKAFRNYKQLNYTLMEKVYLPSSWRKLIRMLNTDDFSYASKNDTEPLYKLRRESKNAFKAAAAYFLLMVLSIIYTLNQDMALDLFQWFLYCRHHILKAYQKYLRGGYVDIPDSLSVSPILPVYMDDIVDFDNRRSQQGDKRDPLRKAQSLSSLELRSRRSGTSYTRVSRSKDKEK